MRSLRTKMVMILVLLILALMTVVGAFLINGVGNYYIDDFYVQMEQTFSQSFISQLQELAASETGSPERMKELLMAQSDLGIDLSQRNVYVLDSQGSVLASSNQEMTVGLTSNVLKAMNGEVGLDSAISAEIMDLAVPIEGGETDYIVYVLDNKLAVNNLTGELFSIIVQSLILGLVICVILAFLLSQILITPITALTTGTRQVAAGEFSQKLEVTSRDEIGTLTRNFNHMSQVLQNTISQVENERTKLSTLFLHMTDGVVAFNPAGTVIHCNPAATRMLSKNLDVTATFEEVFGQDTEFSKLLTLKRSEYLECQKRVGERELELFMAPFSSDQSVGGAMVVIHDVTEQRKSEQTRREFVANVSHELRTPLTNVKSYAETILSAGDDLPKELRENFLGVIVSEADRMTRIVKDLLTLTKFDYGKMEMNISRFAFKEAIENVYKAVALDAQNHGHTLTLECPEDLPHVDGDRERLEQVIMNLVSNAIKYTADGGKISIVAWEGRKHVYLRISDNGIGIPEKDLPRLFERFYRVDKARSRESGGTGLGLSIAKEILTQHQGDIRIESVYGEGTDVTITLPKAE
ncbi:MAG: HAMP domain-containing protein [Oscillospiraceae bacterium]|nr:HAMP domain-containing protein [Oscillospiraceae bacterium]